MPGTPEQISLFDPDEGLISRESLAELLADPAAIFTVGHSNRKLDDLVAVLRGYSVERLIDVRQYPSSRNNPQFNRAALSERLGQDGIDYHWLPTLGGYRPEGYLAHMATPEFARGFEVLESLARERRAAYLCAELEWRRCHRRHISDALAVRGWRVVHLIGEEGAEWHRA